MHRNKCIPSLAFPKKQGLYDYSLIAYIGIIFIFMGKITIILILKGEIDMKTTIALIIKFFVTFGAAWISFMMFGTAALWTVLIISAAGTVLNYLIGDLYVLPRFGNMIASILDGILSGATAWIVLFFIGVNYNYMTSILIFSVMVAVAEIFFHMYLISAHVVQKKKSDFDLLKKSKLNYNTETGSELYPYSQDKYRSNR